MGKEVSARVGTGLPVLVLGSSDVGARVAAPFVEDQHCEPALLLPVESYALATNVPVETPLWSKQYAGPSPTTLAAQRRDRLLHACLTLDHVPAWVPSRLDSLGDRQLIHAGYTARGWMLVPTFRVTRPASFPWRPNSRPGVESFVAACLAQRTL